MFYVVSTMTAVVAILILIGVVYHLNKTAMTYHDMVSDLRNRNLSLRKQAYRERDINRLLVDFMRTLTHDRNSFSISWKLAALRRVENVIKTRGYFNNEVYEFIRDVLSGHPSATRDELIQELKSQVSDYYLMDREDSHHVMEILESLIRAGDLRADATLETDPEAMKRLAEKLKTMRFRLPIVDTKAMDSTMEPEMTMEDAFNRLQEAWNRIQEDIANGNIVLQEMEPRKEEETVEGEKEEVEEDRDDGDGGEGGEALYRDQEEVKADGETQEEDPPYCPPRAEEIVVRAPVLA